MKRSLFLSLRTKLLLVFSILFVMAFAGIWRWFYVYATEQAVGDLRGQLMSAALTAASGIDGAKHAALVQAGQEDTPAYTAVADWLREVKRSNPKIAGVYTYYQAPGETDLVRFAVTSRLVPGAQPDPKDRALQSLPRQGCTESGGRPALGQAYGTKDGLTAAMVLGLQQPGADRTISEDQWGNWLSGYAPITDQKGVTVGAVGVDMCAADVETLQQSVQSHMEIAFGIALVVLLAAVSLVAYQITRPIMALTGAANHIAVGDYGQSAGSLATGWLKDEVSRLSEVFDQMVGKVRSREESLRRQVSELQIIIDEAKSQKEVEAITDTDFFRELQQRAEELRSRRNRGAAKPEEPR